MTHTFVCPMCACQVTLNLDLADDFAYMKQIILGVQDVRTAVRILWLYADGTQEWVEYQKPCVCEECASAGIPHVG